MNESGFHDFLKRNRRKPSAIEQIIPYIAAFEDYLENFYGGKIIEQTTPESLESYVSWLESETGETASKPLWALRYYFDFMENLELSDLAGELRSERVKRKPFMIKNFRCDFFFSISNGTVLPRTLGRKNISLIAWQNIMCVVIKTKHSFFEKEFSFFFRIN